MNRWVRGNHGLDWNDGLHTSSGLNWCRRLNMSCGLRRLHWHRGLNAHCRLNRLRRNHRLDVRCGLSGIRRNYRLCWRHRLMSVCRWLRRHRWPHGSSSTLCNRNGRLERIYRLNRLRGPGWSRGRLCGLSGLGWLSRLHPLHGLDRDARIHRDACGLIRPLPRHGGLQRIKLYGWSCSGLTWRWREW